MINFLVACSSELGNCCSDYVIASVLDPIRRIIGVIQIAAPILLMIGITIDLTKLMIDPEKKKGIKTIFNKFLAALIVFFIPIFMNTVINMMPSSFTVASCFKQSKLSREVVKNGNHTFVDIYKKDENNKLNFDSSAYVNGEKKESDDDSSGNNSGGSSSGDYSNDDDNSPVSGAGAQRLVNVALKEPGHCEKNHGHHKYNSYAGLGDGQPWCAAFVSWCANKAGYVKSNVIPKFTYCPDGYNRLIKMGGKVHKGSSNYTPRAGDIVFFSWSGGGSRDHVGIVVSADKKHVYTVEGNTSASKCGGGHGVSKKTRNRDRTIYAYITPKYPS